MDNLEVRVERGAEYLDGEVPGWAAKIDLKRLDMCGPWFQHPQQCGCVLAQLDASEGFRGDYDAWLERHGLGEEDVGPGWGMDPGYGRYSPAWDHMATRLWTAQIEKRLEGEKDGS